MYQSLRVAVVIPAHQEARLLPRTLATLPDYVDQIFVVDDASTDGTGDVAKMTNDPRVQLISHQRNLGVGGAIVTGYRKACEEQYDAIVVVGADAQMDPTEMHRLLDPLVFGTADYVKGDRLGHPDLSERMPMVRRFGNRVLTLLTRLSSGYGYIRDSQCGYTAVSRSALRQIDLDALYPRYGFPNDVLAKLAEHRLRVMDQPVSPIYGSESSGIRIQRVVGPILWLLLRSGIRRWFRQRALPKELTNDLQRPTPRQAQSQRQSSLS